MIKFNINQKGNSMKKYIITLTAVMMLGACATQEEKSLSQKLSEAVNNVERKEVLYNACISEAEWPAYSNKSKQNGRMGIQYRQEMKRKPEITEMKKLCEQMANKESENKLSTSELSQTCASKVSSKKEKGWEGWTEHASRIESICTQMLNLKTTN
jgi:hypothetical protein